MILLQTKKVQHTFSISQLWTSTKAYMRYAFLLHFFMVPIGCFAANAQEYSQEDDFYKLHWASRVNSWMPPNQIPTKKIIYVHEACTLSKLKDQIGDSNMKLSFFKDNEGAGGSISKKDDDDQKTIKALNTDNSIGLKAVSEEELKGKEVITLDGKKNFNALPKKPSSTEDDDIDQTSIQEPQPDLQENNNNKGNNTNNRIAISIIIVAIVSTASYLWFSSKKTKKKVSNT